LVTLIAKGDVALSVLMTTGDTPTLSSEQPDALQHELIFQANMS
jgi:hypothetical protein